MNGTTPLPPNGVVTAATTTHQNRVTWQPETNARVALVVQAYMHSGQSGYVLVGRSLKEVEAREDMLSWMTIAAAAAVIMIGAFTFAVYSKR